MKRYIVIFCIFTTLYPQSPQEILNSMSLDEKIGQLFMVGIHADKKAAPAIENSSNIVTQHHVGNLIFMRGSAQNQARLTNYFQSISKLPLLCAQDAEWGVAMRLVGVEPFPKNMTLGALRDTSLIFKVGKEIAKQCKAVGVNLNFAPVVDLNSNPKNPVIHMRSFGDNPIKVAKRASAFIEGLESENVLACAKHFPGHGDVDVDSHLDLPVVKHSLERLKMELYPFTKLINSGLRAIMTAHLHVPALDNAPNMPATMSRAIVHDLLRPAGFDGLIFSDSLTMQGITKHFSIPQAAVKSFKAGCDILLICRALKITDRTVDDAGVDDAQDVCLATIESIKAIKKAIETGEIKIEEINKSVLRILKAKESFALFDNRCDLNNEKTKELNQDIFDNALTLVQNKYRSIPLNQKDKGYVIAIGGQEKSTFLKEMNSKMPSFEQAYISMDAPTDYWDILKGSVIQYNPVVIGMADLSTKFSENFGVSSGAYNFIKALVDSGKQVVLILFGTPYVAKFFEHADSLLVAYEDCVYSNISAAKIVSGEMVSKGVLPVNVSKKFKEGTGL